ncbi:hypothetical protein E2C01_093297 [Portunus trituberculatus]|uniref:Uncharacterized protein n=1 Tax=Portunus trituberculatus TaxID=210409 RepID=A0A5B7JIM4_PORTR|nr:hypothetical protein [Portunus trituberculatus]
MYFTLSTTYLHFFFLCVKVWHSILHPLHFPLHFLHFTSTTVTISILLKAPPSLPSPLIQLQLMSLLLPPQEPPFLPTSHCHSHPLPVISFPITSTGVHSFLLPVSLLRYLPPLTLFFLPVFSVYSITAFTPSTSSYR